MPLEIPGIISDRQVRQTADHIASWQLPSGMIPWFPDGHADPWNHIEAAMALVIGDRRAEAEAAYQWLVDMQRDDGSWHQYYLADGVEQDKLDANVIAYVAAGVWHHYLHFRDLGYLEEMWKVVEPAIDFVLDLQQPRGEILWARHPDGTAWSFALLTGSSSIAHSLCCAVAIAEELHHERPDWELSVGLLAHAIRHEREEAFSPKHRWAMDWYYPVLAGATTGDAAKARLADGWPTFAMENLGVRCVADEPWVTASETGEAALAYAAIGDVDTATDLLRWIAPHRLDSGAYFTGIVHPERITFPDGEQTSYTAAAVILAADAITGASGASNLFIERSLRTLDA